MRRIGLKDRHMRSSPTPFGAWTKGQCDQSGNRARFTRYVVGRLARSSTNWWKKSAQQPEKSTSYSITHTNSEPSANARGMKATSKNPPFKPPFFSHLRGARLHAPADGVRSELESRQRRTLGAMEPAPSQQVSGLLDQTIEMALDARALDVGDKQSRGGGGDGNTRIPRRAAPKKREGAPLLKLGHIRLLL